MYVNTSNPDEMKKVEYTLDCLIVTINAAVDWIPYLAAMRPNGAFVVVGAIPQPLEFHAFSLLMKNVRYINDISSHLLILDYQRLMRRYDILLIIYCSKLSLVATSVEVKTLRKCFNLWPIILNVNH